MSLSGAGSNFTIAEGRPGPGPGIPIATFHDSDQGDTASAFSATIDWGDGTTTTGDVSGSNGSFTVSGLHSYADEMAAAVTTTVTRTADSSHLTITGSATATEGDSLFVSGTNFSANPGVAFNGTVATVSDSFTGNVAGDFTATINWGDGSPTSVGTISGSGGSFTVSGSHTYMSGGNFAVGTTVTDDAPGTATAHGIADATVNLAGTMALVSATEAVALSNAPVATFSDSFPDQASGFSATINWGDGTSSAGAVTGGPGTFTVQGSHTYTDEGSDQASVTLTRTFDHATSTVSGSVAVAEADVLTPHPMNIAAKTHQVFSGAVATFDDTFTTNVPGDFVATIDWGDGTTSAGTVSGGGGMFTVSGSHAYAATGQENVTATLADDAPGTASATVVSTATVSQGPSIPFDLNGDVNSDLVFQNNGQPGIWLMNGPTPIAEVALANPGASWHVVTSRDVNGDGKADLIWQNNDGTPGIWLMNGTTPIAEVGLTNPGPSWHVVASGDTNGDGNADLIWQNTDGTLGVWEMNGTTPIAEVGLTNPGSTWKVVGAADFNGDGRDDILLQNSTNGNLMVDLMNGTSIASSVTISVGDPSWHAISTGVFNGVTEIAWQNSNGTPGIWLMNGTTPVAEAGLQNPGPGWQVISVDHFTANGHADLLFQNTSGAMGLWELNGTNIVAETNLPNPGAGWQSVNGHPFATG